MKRPSEYPNILDHGLLKIREYVSLSYCDNEFASVDTQMIIQRMREVKQMSQVMMEAIFE